MIKANDRCTCQFCNFVREAQANSPGYQPKVLSYAGILPIPNQRGELPADGLKEIADSLDAVKETIELFKRSPEALNLTNLISITRLLALAGDYDLVNKGLEQMQKLVGQP